VKEDTELENSDSNHLTKDIVVKDESRLLAFKLLVALIFNVGSTWFFFGHGF
jgi:hypothetical protein